MRKLILTSIKAKTGDTIWEEDRLVVVNHNPGDVELDLMVRATQQVRAWFETEKPNAEYISIIPKATIGEPAEEQKGDIEVYTRKGLLEFANWVIENNYGAEAIEQNIDRWKSSIKVTRH